MLKSFQITIATLSARGFTHIEWDGKSGLVSGRTPGGIHLTNTPEDWRRILEKEDLEAYPRQDSRGDALHVLYPVKVGSVWSAASIVEIGVPLMIRPFKTEDSLLCAKECDQANMRNGYGLSDGKIIETSREVGLHQPPKQVAVTVTKSYRTTVMVEAGALTNTPRHELSRTLNAGLLTPSGWRDEGELPTWEINAMYTIENETP